MVYGHTMTAEQATTFDRESSSNATLLKSVLACNCNPYADVFTFNRWKAQNMCVNKGEHGIRLPLIREVTEQNENGDKVKVKRVLGHSYVFCRCQVHPFGNKHESTSQPIVTRPQSEPKAQPVNNADSRIDNLMKGWNAI